ncbi:MAG: hypothetical protein JO342_12900 [Solirubrobacterales bacterium]|nr:hypothetical protein [Solirubrobacterales bacterium]
MTLSTYISEQLAAAHRRDLLEAAERHRMAAQANAHRRRPSPSPAPGGAARSRPVADRRPVADPCLCATCTRGATG